MIPPGLTQSAIADVPAVVRGRITTRTIDVPGCRLVHATFEPGARWSVDAAPFAGTALCQRPHDALVLAGTLGLQVIGGAAEEISAGHVIHVPAGHDAWCASIGSCIMLEVESAPVG